MWPTTPLGVECLYCGMAHVAQPLVRGCWLAAELTRSSQMFVAKYESRPTSIPSRKLHVISFVVRSMRINCSNSRNLQPVTGVGPHGHADPTNIQPPDGVGPGGATTGTGVRSPARPGSGRQELNPRACLSSLRSTRLQSVIPCNPFSPGLSYASTRHEQ
jgi:hypothetical protein